MAENCQQHLGRRDHHRSLMNHADVEGSVLVRGRGCRAVAVGAAASCRRAVGGAAASCLGAAVSYPISGVLQVRQPATFQLVERDPPGSVQPRRLACHHRSLPP